MPHDLSMKKPLRINQQLPHGQRTLEHEMIIDQLTKDEVFLGSMAEDLGTIIKVYPDWDNNRLVYELRNGNTFESKLSDLIKKMKEINYMKDFAH